MIPAALILAGGRGSRLAPWPAPKCLLPVNGVSLIERLIAHVERHVERIVVCTGYRASDVEAALRHRPNVLFSNAGEDAEMGARLLRARNQYEITGCVLILYGDELSDVQLAALEEHHLQSAPSPMTYTAYPERLPFGIIRGGRICDGERVLINIGFVLAEPSTWATLQRNDGLSDWINRTGAGFYLHQGRRATVNSLADLQRAEEVWATENERVCAPPPPLPGMPPPASPEHDIITLDGLRQLILSHEAKIGLLRQGEQTGERQHGAIPPGTRVWYPPNTDGVMELLDGGGIRLIAPTGRCSVIGIHLERGEYAERFGAKKKDK